MKDCSGYMDTVTFAFTCFTSLFHYSFLYPHRSLKIIFFPLCTSFGFFLTMNFFSFLPPNCTHFFKSTSQHGFKLDGIRSCKLIIYFSKLINCPFDFRGESHTRESSRNSGFLKKFLRKRINDAEESTLGEHSIMVECCLSGIMKKCCHIYF